MPGSVRVEPIIAMTARTSRPFSTSATSAMRPAGAVVEHHEDEHRGEADEGRERPLPHQLGPEGRADGALLEDGHRRGERAGLEDEGDVVRLLEHLLVVCARAERDLPVGGDAPLDVRRGLDLVVEHGRHAPLHVLGGELLHEPRALGRHREGHHRACRRRSASVLSMRRARVGDVVAGQLGLRAEQVGPVVARPDGPLGRRRPRRCRSTFFCGSRSGFAFSAMSFSSSARVLAASIVTARVPPLGSSTSRPSSSRPRAAAGSCRRGRRGRAGAARGAGRAPGSRRRRS